MDFLQMAGEILAQFAQQALPPTALHQIARASVHSIETSPCGLFANLESESKEIFDDGNGTADVSIIRTLVDCEEIADAMLHFKDGRIQYMEIQLYDRIAGWGRLADAHLE